MAEEQLRRAFTLAKQGNRTEALQIVKTVLQQDKNNVKAWWLMANLLEKPEQKEKAAQRVLSLKPEHAGAKKLLASLTGSSSPQRPESTAATQEQQYDWSKLEAKNNPKKSGGGIRTAAGCFIGVMVLAGFGIIIAVILGGQFLETARIRDSYDIDNSSLEAQLESTIEYFLIEILEPDVRAANVFFCFEMRSTTGQVEGAEGSLEGRSGFDVSFEGDGIRVSNISQDGDVIEARVRGDVLLTSTEDSSDTRVVSVQTFFDSVDPFSADNFRFVYEDDEWRICPSN